MTDGSKNLVIGIGNEYRHDDAVGLYIVRELKKRELLCCDIKESPGEGTYLMDSWQARDKVIVVDAVQSQAIPGKIHRIDTQKTEIPDDWFKSSSHLFSLPQAIKLSKTLGTLPKELIIYGIEGDLFNTGTDMSPAVKESTEKLIEMIAEELS